MQAIFLVDRESVADGWDVRADQLAVSSVYSLELYLHPSVSPTVSARTYTYCKPCSLCSRTDPRPTNLSPLCLVALSSEMSLKQYFSLRLCSTRSTQIGHLHAIHVHAVNQQFTNEIPENFNQVQDLLHVRPAARLRHAVAQRRTVQRRSSS